MFVSYWSVIGGKNSIYFKVFTSLAAAAKGKPPNGPKKTSANFSPGPKAKRWKAK